MTHDMVFSVIVMMVIMMIMVMRIVMLVSLMRIVMIDSKIICNVMRIMCSTVHPIYN